MAKDGESEGLFEEALQTTVLENILPCLLQVRGRIPSFLTFLEDTHQLRQFSLFVVRGILGDIVMSFSKLTDYPTLVAHRSVKLQIWGKMLIVKKRI
ncbi:hypothetical protein KXW18_006753, partial [Aspergillus fumigatus]